MDRNEILNFIEDKDIKINDNWYFHATSDDIETIKNILTEGIKSAYLIGQKGNNFNGKYYISLYKNTSDSERLNKWLKESPKLIIQGISPYYADSSKHKLRQFFINTRIPLRTSEWNGEYQQYLKIEPSNIVALEYSLTYILSSSKDSNIKQKIEFLKSIILCMEQINKNLPIYDLSANREINKQKTLSLHL